LGGGGRAAKSAVLGRGDCTADAEEVGTALVHPRLSAWERKQQSTGTVW